MDRQELIDLGTSIWERLRNAVKRGDQSEALALIDVASRNSERMHGHLTDTVDLLFTALAEKAGEEAIYELQKDNYFRVVSPNLADQATLTPEQKIRRWAGIWTELHGSSLEIEEDEDKFTLRVPCSTGGNLVARGKYGKTSRAYPWSAGQAGIAYYCVHCPISFELLWSQEHGYPCRINIPPLKPGEKCVQYVYKDPRAVPVEFYNRVGLKKH